MNLPYAAAQTVASGGCDAGDMIGSASQHSGFPRSSISQRPLAIVWRPGSGVRIGRYGPRAPHARNTRARNARVKGNTMAMTAKLWNSLARRARASRQAVRPQYASTRAPESFLGRSKSHGTNSGSALSGPLSPPRRRCASAMRCHPLAVLGPADTIDNYRLP